MIAFLPLFFCLTVTSQVSGMHDGRCCASITNVTLVSATAASVEFVYPGNPSHPGESLLFDVVQNNAFNSSSTQFVVEYNIGNVEYFDYLYTGLDTNSTYCFRINGTLGGWNNYCYDQVAPVCLDTTQENPLGALPTVSTFDYVRDANNTSIVSFSWSLNDDGNGILSCVEETFVVTNLFFFKGVSNSSSAIVRGFRDSALYTCYLSGQNLVGVGKNMSISFRTRPLPPTSLNATALGFDMISISWSHFSPETVEYTVHVNRQCSPDKQNYVSYNATSGTSRINVLSLTPFTVYCIDVIATSTDANLESAPSQVVSVRTLEAVPGPVSSLLVIPLSSNALFMRWSEPDHKNGIILGYNVIVGSLEAFVDNDARFLEVNNLDPCEGYAVNVIASTSAGTGQVTSLFRRTLDSVPTRPEITSVDPQRRLVSWSISQPIACLEGSTVTYTPLYSIDRTISVNYSHSDPFRTEDLPSDLEETVAYNVTISAYGPAGYGERSQSFHLAPLLTRFPSVFSVSDRTDYAHLIFVGIKNCTPWKIDITENDIGSLLSYRLSLICPQYGELSNNQWIVESSLMCLGTSHQVVFRFRSNVRLEVKQCLEYWYSSPSPFLKLQNQILLVDTGCNHLYTRSLHDNLCFETSTSGLVDGVFGGLVLGGLLASVVFLIVLTICFRNRICEKCFKCGRDTNVSKYASDTENDREVKHDDDDDGYEELPFVGTRGHSGMTCEDLESAYVDVSVESLKVKQSNGAKTAAVTTAKDFNHQTAVRESNMNDPDYELPEIFMQNMEMHKAEYDPIVSSQNVETLGSSKKHNVGTAAKQVNRATPQQKPKPTSQNYPIAAKTTHVSNVSSKAICELVPQDEVKTGTSKVPILPPTKLNLKHERKPLHGQQMMAVTAVSTGTPSEVPSAKHPVHSKVKSKEAERVKQKNESLPQAPSSSVALVPMQKPASGNKKRPLFPKHAVGQKKSKVSSGITPKSATNERGQAPRILPKPKNKSTKDISLSTNSAYEQWTITQSDET